MTEHYAIYEQETGKLVSVGTEVADPLPAGLAAVPVDGPENGRPWDGSSLSFAAPAAEAEPAEEPASEQPAGRARHNR